MKIKTSILAICMSAITSLEAQTNSSAPPSDFFSGLGSLATSAYSAIQQSGVMNATNYAPYVYATYAPKAKDNFGGGGGVVFNVPALSGTNGAVGTMLGVDWLGSWSIVNASLTIKATTRPLNIGLFSFLPDSIRMIQVEPIIIGGVWGPLSGGGAGGTLWDTGADIQFGHLWGGRFCGGILWGEWNNNTVEPGHRFHGFLAWRKGF